MIWLKRKMIRVYVAGKYNAPTHYEVQQNIDLASSLAKHLWSKNYAVFCPHMNSAHYGGLIDESKFLDGCLEWVSVSDEVYVLPNFYTSNGAKEEIKLAIKLHLPIYFYGYYYSQWYFIYSYKFHANSENYMLEANQDLISKLRLYNKFLVDSSQVNKFIKTL